MTQKTFDEIIDIIENCDVNIGHEELQIGCYYRDISFFSPLGEDYHGTVWYDGTPTDFIEQFERFASDFDADEHAEQWVTLRGTHGVPDCTIRELIEDADDIKNTLQHVATELSA